MQSGGQGGAQPLGKIFCGAVERLGYNLFMANKGVLKSVSWLLFVGVLASCGGGKLGDSCSSAGTTSGCGDGLVCTGGSSSATCARLCTTDADCDAGQNCNGITGSTLKSCQ